MPTLELEDPILHIAVLIIAGIAAFTDVRKGEIPNWLTLPILVFAPIVHGVVNGTSGLLHSIIGLLVCALVPLILYYREGMAGGDVKVFAAIGAVGGVYLGLEAQFLSLVAAAIYALGQLAWNGKLMTGLGNTVFVGLNPVLPRRWRRSVPVELMHRIRLGAAILLGTALAVLDKHPELFS